MKISNPSKAMIALCGLFCITLLMIFERVETSQGMPAITLIIGYAVGNGIAAKQGDDVQPIIGKRDTTE